MTDLPAEAIAAAEAELAEYLFGRGPDDYDVRDAARAALEAAAPAIREQAAAAERQRWRAAVLKVHRTSTLGGLHCANCQFLWPCPTIQELQSAGLLRAQPQPASTIQQEQP